MSWNQYLHLNRESMIKAPLRTVIVDDESAGRDLLKFLLSQRPDIEVIGVYGNSRAAITGIRRGKPDLVFLDVQMPGRDGFTLLDELGPDAPPVIFVTAFDEYALKAFDIGAFDYVLKPVDEARFFYALDRAIRRINVGESAGAPANGMTQLIRELKAYRESYIRYLPIKVKDRMVLQRVEDVTWFEADGKYVRVHVGADRHLVRRTLLSLDEKLNPDKFLRVSRSAIVNIEMVRHLEPWVHGDWVIVLANGRRVFSTHGYRDRLKTLLKEG
jgi:two-component system, LytTR family, response regulator